ncbi:MAG: lectin like domain-containing protein [Synergistaceae bacterium]|jgi:C1A family cysteine protease|nr:lectin like domain-containing protein [Synergistaceae bacterium]
MDLAPLSAAFAEYSRNPEAWSGLLPSPVDRSHLSALSARSPAPSQPGGAIAARDSTRYAGLPRKFDLRDLGYVTSVKNQGSGDDCWTYAAAGSMESTYLRQTGKALDLSEYHLSWFAFSGERAFTGTVRGGGFDNNSVSLLARWTGPVLESAIGGVTELSGGEADYPAALHLENAYFLGLEFLDDPNLYLKPGDDIRKRLVRDFGAVSAGMYSDGLGTDSRYYDMSNCAWFYKGVKRYPDHSVLLVGWDDDYPRTNFNAQNQPSSDGAWLVKNSWGSGFGEKGYFWISYEDEGLSDGVAFLAGEADNYDKNYGYDDLGWCSSSSVGAGQTAWLSNVFRSSEDDEAVKAVSFYATSNNTSYEIYIYTDLADKSDPTSGTLSSKTSGSIELAGYHTVSVPEAALAPETDFSAVLRVTTPGYDYPAAMEAQIENYSDNAVIERGVSFISTDGDNWADSASQGANVCVRAFTSKASPIREDGGGGCSAGAAFLIPLLAAVYCRYGKKISRTRPKSPTTDPE